MTLLNAPQFDEQKETRQRNILVGSGVLLVVLVLLTVGGFLLGHGWLFMNLPVEHKVNNFLSALQAGDYPKAYGIFYNDPSWQQHPDKYKDYPLLRFTEDFTTESEWKAPITSFHVDFSKRDATGTVVASTINGTTNLTLKYQRSDGTLSFFPYVLTRGL
ncbi:MAG TPA: hypothetical protein VF865_09130 [Acidobacteriaceae bacterium]